MGLGYDAECRRATTQTIRQEHRRGPVFFNTHARASWHVGDQPFPSSHMINVRGRSLTIASQTTPEKRRSKAQCRARDTTARCRKERQGNSSLPTARTQRERTENTSTTEQMHADKSEQQSTQNRTEQQHTEQNSTTAQHNGTAASQLETKVLRATNDREGAKLSEQERAA